MGSLSFRILFCFLILSVTSRVWAIETIVINDSINEFYFNHEKIQYYEDPSGDVTIDQVITPQYAERFVYSNNEFVDRDVPQNHNAQSYYWIRVKLKHSPNSTKLWLFEFANQSIDHIDVYVPDSSGKYHKATIGDVYPFDQRWFAHKNNEIFIPNQLKGEYFYYFRMKSTYPMGFVLALRSVDGFVGYALQEYILFGVFFGMLLIVVVYNLLMYAALQEKQFLYYVIYTFCFGLYFAAFTGIAFQYVWSSWVAWNQVAHDVALYLVVISGLVFSRKFLNIDEEAPELLKYYKLLLILRTLFFIACWFDFQLFHWRIIEIIPIAFVTYVGVSRYKKGFKPARFYILAYSLLCLGFVLKALLSFGFIAHHPALFYADCITFSFEMFFLMIALSDKVRIIKEEKEVSQEKIISQLEENERLKDKVNRELEQKVQERTIEINQQKKLIEEANDKLKEQAEEIQQMNLMLDLDNRSLKKDIKKTMEAQVMKDSLNFEEFKNVFPDNLACFRYLNEKKLTQGFECHKCGNEKHSPGAKKFSRRCTKCGYNESVTAYTVFHGLRFPIEKAFYIFYLTINYGKELTVDEISEKVELRRNTSWNFRNKVLDLMERAKKKKKRPTTEDYWDEIFG